MYADHSSVWDARHFVSGSEDASHMGSDPMASVTFVPLRYPTPNEGERMLGRENGIRDKVLSFCSDLFRKENKNTKRGTERKRREQDEMMAQFVTQLQMEGMTDQEIALHLYHIQDVPLVPAPPHIPVYQQNFYPDGPLPPRTKNFSIGGFFRSMQQALKSEFSLREKAPLTFQVSSVDPFFAAPPTDYLQDIGFTYEDATTLEPVCAEVRNLDHLPVSKFDGKPLPSEQTTCAICLGDFENGESLRSLQCFHFFHKECIDKWLGVGHVCPVCKSQV